MNTKTLADLSYSDTATVIALNLPDGVQRRLMEMGVIPGLEVTVGSCAPSGDPCIYHIDGASIALRRDTAVNIEVQHKSTDK